LTVKELEQSVYRSVDIVTDDSFVLASIHTFDGQTDGQTDRMSAAKLNAR